MPIAFNQFQLHSMTYGGMQNKFFLHFLQNTLNVVQAINTQFKED